MRLMVFFDIPVEPESSKKEYMRFRKFLLKNGYDMVQFSVYSRFCHNEADSEKHIKRLKENKPNSGDVRVLKITESQYTNMIFLHGEKNAREKVENRGDLIAIE